MKGKEYFHSLARGYFFLYLLSIFSIYKPPLFFTLLTTHFFPLLTTHFFQYPPPLPSAGLFLFIISIYFFYLYTPLTFVIPKHSLLSFRNTHFCQRFFKHEKRGFFKTLFLYIYNTFFFLFVPSF